MSAPNGSGLANSGRRASAARPAGDPSGLPHRRTTRVMRLWEWANPPRAEHREVLEVLPEQDTGQPPLVFVHGLGHGAWCFAEHWLTAAAQAGYPAYAVSLRGHGGSGGHRRLGRTMLRDYVHDVMQTIIELPSPPVLVGHSMGSLVTQLVMERYPVRAAALLTPLPPSGVFRTMTRLGLKAPLDAGRALVGVTLPLRPKYLFSDDLPPERAEAFASRLGRESPWAQYALLRPRRIGPTRAPVMVMGAEDDNLVSAGDVEACARTYGTEVVWVPGGHDVMLDAHWEAALATLLHWVDDVAPAGAPALPGLAALDAIRRA